LGAAVFGQIDWAVTERLHILPGLRYNYDRKKVNYDRRTYGGLQTDDPELLAIKRAIYTDQSFTAEVDESNLSGQLTVSFKATSAINDFATASTSYNPVGVYMRRLPSVYNEVATEPTQNAPKYVSHYEVGLKTTTGRCSKQNLTLYNSNKTGMQHQVRS